MPSRRERARPDFEELVFFVDRGLGRNHVPAVFRRAGFRVVLMSDYYPNGTDQSISDDCWIADISREGWVALTKDLAVARVHRAALACSTLRLFALDSARLTGPEMAGRFAKHLHRIVQQARHPGPYAYVVRSNGLERKWAP